MCNQAKKGVFARHENRYYRHATLNLSVTFFFLKGNAIHGIDPPAGVTAAGTGHGAGGARGPQLPQPARREKPNARARSEAWRFRSVVDFLDVKVRPLAPTALVLNVGAWWFRRDYPRHAWNATWWDRVLDASEAAVTPVGGRVILRTTTPPAPWRKKDNDGVDQVRSS